MIYLTGHIRMDLLRHPMIGFLNTPRMRNLLPKGVTWAADNGCFSAPENYSDVRYLAWLGKHPVDRCLFAVCPDVLADHLATVKRSRPLMPLLRKTGYRPAFVAQDGWQSETTPWDEFDVLFIGGSTRFKLSPRTADAAMEALDRGKTVHMGRVNSFKRLLLAQSLGCTSVDGTFLKFAPDANFPRMLSWFAKLPIGRLI